ncbi:MAG: hypothetical protein WD021_08775 [Rhodothermales bacterium]
MQASTEYEGPNPLSELISDDVFKLLEEHNLFNEKSVRDFQIRRKFRRMREEEVPAYDAIESLRGEYPYLQFDTIRKIVYKLNNR